LEEDTFNFTRKPKYAFDEYVEMDDFGGYNEMDDMDEVDEPMQAPTAEPVAPAAPAPTFNANPVSLKIVTPKTYDDAREITEFLMNGNTILLNMDGISREVAVRVIDYLRGAIQVVAGMMTKVGKTTLVVAPKNVDVSSIEAMVGSAE
jgi:cell division inhibitor SepF